MGKIFENNEYLLNLFTVFKITAHVLVKTLFLHQLINILIAEGTLSFQRLLEM